MLRILIFLVTAVFTLPSCSTSADTAAAEQQVAVFHSLLDERSFEDIYDASAADLKKVTTQQDFVALLEAVHRKLGVIKSFEKTSWKVNFHTSGTFVALTYKTVYAEGEAAEQFVYRIEGESAKLVGYHISSNALILK